MAEFASKGVAGSGLGLGIAGTALGVLNGGLGNLLGGWNANNCGCSENMLVNRYEAAKDARISELETEVKLRDANTYTDQKLLDMYRFVNNKFERIDHQLCEQAVWNTAQTGTISCMAQQIAVLNGLTKTVIPASSICPPVMPRYNSFVTPTETAPDASTGT